MSWFAKLYETYDHCLDMQSRESAGPALLPVSHSRQYAHIIVRLNGRGEFLGADFAENGKMQAIIPATEKSAGRTSGAAAHPLCDKIHYCAKDYQGTKDNNFDLYERELAAWCASEHSHPKARAVYAYISKGTLVRDLLAAGRLQADDQGCLLTEAPAENPSPLFKQLAAKKVDGKNVRDQGDAFVCWRVDIPGDICPETWRDASLQEAWSAYDASQMQDMGLCMVLGREVSVAGQHPRNIRWPGDGSKLVSGNDFSGFTFRGRFDSFQEALSVGYETSHKAHNALRWLIERQGWRNGDQVVLAWAVRGGDIPDPMDGRWLDDFDVGAPGDPDAEASDAALGQSADLGRAFALRLKKSLGGYLERLDEHEEVVILGLDSTVSGKGRLSVTFYRDMFLGDYLNRLEQWQEDFAWPLLRWPRGAESGEKPCIRKIVAAPTPGEIVLAAYGPRADAALDKTLGERLLPCIADAACLPRDVMESAFRRVCVRSALEGWEFPRALAVACALIKGYHSKRNPVIEERRDYSMTLDTHRKSRDYLYGRLLALAEYTERAALELAGESRSSNAERLFQRFADRPASTWMTLSTSLSPYLTRLQQNQKTRGLWVGYHKISQEISGGLEEIGIDDSISDRRLGPEFLLGYHLQMASFYAGRKKTATADGDETPENTEAQVEGA